MTGWPEFEKETGAKVSVVYAQTDDEIWSKIKGSEGEDFDLFAVNTSELQRYIDAGLAVPHDLAQMPNQQQTLPQFRDLAQVRGVDARRQGLRHSVRLRFHRADLRHDQGQAAAGFDGGAVGSEIQGQDPALRCQRPQFLVRGAGARASRIRST